MNKIFKFIIISAISVCILSSCSKETAVATPSEEQVKSICELATLKCNYNNVAKSIKKKGKGLSHAGEKDKEFWIEYEGFANIGIEMSDVTMKINDNAVTITMPKAKLLDIGIVSDTLNKDSFILSNDGWNKNKITADDQRNAISDAQKEMKKTVKENKALYARAEDRAKQLIENYITQLGNLSGIEYEIIWKTKE